MSDCWSDVVGCVVHWLVDRLIGRSVTVHLFVVSDRSVPAPAVVTDVSSPCSRTVLSLSFQCSRR